MKFGLLELPSSLFLRIGEVVVVGEGVLGEPFIEFGDSLAVSIGTSEPVRNNLGLSM